MARLALAVLIVALLAAGALVVALGIRAALAGGTTEKETGNPMQKIAFALLVALILYVALQGAA